MALVKILKPVEGFDTLGDAFSDWNHPLLKFRKERSAAVIQTLRFVWNKRNFGIFGVTAASFAVYWLIKHRSLNQALSV